MVTVKICGTELKADLFNPDVIAIHEEATDEAIKEITRNIDGENGSAGVRRQCSAVCKCIDKVFGAGSSDKLFPEGVNLLECLDAFDDLCSVYEKQLAPMIQKRALKYSTARAQRNEYLN